MEHLLEFLQGDLCLQRPSELLALLQESIERYCLLSESRDEATQGRHTPGELLDVLEAGRPAELLDRRDPVTVRLDAAVRDDEAE